MTDFKDTLKFPNIKNSIKSVNANKFSEDISKIYALNSPLGENSLFYKKNIAGIIYDLPTTNPIWKYTIETSTKGTELIDRYLKYDEKIDLSKGKYDEETDLVIYIEQSSTINGYIIDMDNICLIRMSQEMLKEYNAAIKGNPKSTILEDWSSFILNQQKNVNNITFVKEKLVEAFKMEIAYRPLQNISFGATKHTNSEFTDAVLDGFSESFRKLKFERESWDPTLKSETYLLKNTESIFNFYKNQIQNSIGTLEKIETAVKFFEYLIPSEKLILKTISLFINSLKADLSAIEIFVDEIKELSPYLFAFLCGAWDGLVEFVAGFLDMILLVIKLYFQFDEINVEDKLAYLKLKEGIVEFIENYIKDPDFFKKAIGNTISNYFEERYSNSDNGYVTSHNAGEDLIIALDIIFSIVEIVKSIADAGKVLSKFENWIDNAFERNNSLRNKLEEIHAPKSIEEIKTPEIPQETKGKLPAKERVEKKKKAFERKQQEKKILQQKTISGNPAPSYENGFEYYDARTPKSSEIPVHLKRPAKLLTYKVDKEVQSLLDLNHTSGFSKNKKILFNKKGKKFIDERWLQDRQLVAGIIHQDKKLGEIIVSKTNFPKSEMKKFLSIKNWERGKVGPEEIKEIYKYFKQKGHIEYDMHPHIQGLIKNHFDEINKGLKHPASYDWGRTGGLPGTHAEVLALNDLLWTLENKGISLNDEVLKGFIGYNKNILKGEYMIRCGDCQLILKDIVFLEKITKFK